MDGKQLKNSILQWAIQGKLVPQNPKDEPAQKLLERIAASRNAGDSRHSERSEESSKGSKKMSLRGAKATKQSKNPTSRIYRENDVWYEQVGTATPKDISDEIPFEIPKTWTWCRLDSLGTFVRGNGIKRDETTSKGKPCVRYGEMYTTYKVKFSEVKSFTSPIVFDKCQKFHRNDILMALTGENKWDIALAAVYQGDEEVALGGDMCKFSPFECNSLYLVYLINSPYGIDYKRETSTGDIIVHTSASKLGNFLVPLPPIAEQKRIVAKLEQVLPLAEEYGAVQEQLNKLNKELPEALKKSVLQEAIQGKLVPQSPKDGCGKDLAKKLIEAKKILISCGKVPNKAETKPFFTQEDLDAMPIPENWCWVQLSNVSIIQEGAGIRKNQYRNSGTQILCVTNILEGKVDLEKKQLFISTDEYLEKYKHLTLNHGDIVTSCSGGSWGKTARFYAEKTMMLNTSTLRLRFFDDLADNNYLYYLCKTPFFKKQLEQQLSGMQPNFGYAHYSRIMIPLPPLAEQKRIVAKLEQLFKVL